MNEKTVSQRLVLRMMTREPSLIEKYMADPDKTLDEIEQHTAPAGYDGKRKPSVSVGPRMMIFVKFTSEPRSGGTDNYGKERQYADIIMLAPTDQGWLKEKGKIDVKANEEAAINLARHAALLKGAQANAPLTGKCFCIANMGKRKTAKGNSANDYRWKAIDCPKD